MTIHIQSDGEYGCYVFYKDYEINFNYFTEYERIDDIIKELQNYIKENNELIINKKNINNDKLKN